MTFRDGLPLVLCILALRPALACDDLTVRDAAFTEPRDVHCLYVLASGADATAKATLEGLQRWLQTSAPDLNVEAIGVSADAPELSWREMGIPSAPPSLPVVILTGRMALERRTFLVDHWEPGPGPADLEILKTSPARDALRKEVGRRLAVLLYCPGTGPDREVEGKVIESAAQKWSRKESLGVSVVRLDRADERERVLLSFTGIGKEGPDWLAVVFGRGKILPPILGKEITEERIDEDLAQLVEECTCLRSAASLGVDLPLLWEQTLDEAALPLRAGDPAGEAAASPSQPELEPGGAGPPVGDRAFRRVAWTVGILSALAALIAGGLIWQRKAAR
jgi:hypothetical protein